VVRKRRPMAAGPRSIKVDGAGSLTADSCCASLALAAGCQIVYRKELPTVCEK